MLTNIDCKNATCPPDKAKKSARQMTACALIMVGAQSAWARQPAPPASAASLTGYDPNEAQPQEHGYYVSKSGRVVHPPAQSVNGSAPGGESAKCRDGTYSSSKHHMVAWRSGCDGLHGPNQLALTEHTFQVVA